jgi:hypothetical protein
MVDGDRDAQDAQPTGDNLTGVRVFTGDQAEGLAAKCGPDVSYWFEKIPQDEAQYEALGGTDTEACANCRWFISPNNCGIVASWPDNIAPTGRSDRWEAVPVVERDPLKVVIVEEGSAEVSAGVVESPPVDTKAETKREGGIDFPASDFAVVPDSTKPSTWKLRLAEGRAGNRTVAQVARAITALQPSGFRGRRVQLSSAERTGAIRKISGAIRGLTGTAEQKRNLRERLDAVKERTIEVRVPQRMFEAVKDRVAALLKRSDEHRPFVLYKDDSGDLRWFAWASNNWRDHDNPPEIITEKAHLDYVAYVDKSGRYPEAWLWHTHGTKWGQADWVDYADGFLVVSGTVDPGREHVADALAADKDMGVSHGFVYGQADPIEGTIGWYRSFEVSALPADAAANPWTSIDVLAKEADMGFNAAKRAFLVEKVGEDEVARLEREGGDAKARLEALGIESKGMPPDDDNNDKDPVPAAIDTKALATAAGEAAVKALTESDAFKGLTTVQAEQGEALKGLTARMDALQRSDDEKVAALVGARDTRQGGHQASASDGNVVAQKDAPPGPDGQKPEEEDWFGAHVMKGIEAGAGTAGAGGVPRP